MGASGLPGSSGLLAPAWLPLPVVFSRQGSLNTVDGPVLPLGTCTGTIALMVSLEGLPPHPGLVSLALPSNKGCSFVTISPLPTPHHPPTPIESISCFIRCNLIFFNFFPLQLIYSVLSISAVQPSDPVTHIRIYILFLSCYHPSRKHLPFSPYRVQGGGETWARRRYAGLPGPNLLDLRAGHRADGPPSVCPSQGPISTQNTSSETELHGDTSFPCSFNFT